MADSTLSTVPLHADNLDLALQEFQKRWFPKEIKAKEKDANKEIEKEMAQEMELDAKCIIA